MHSDAIYLTVCPHDDQVRRGRYLQVCGIFLKTVYFPRSQQSLDGYCRVQVVESYRRSENIWLIVWQDCHQPTHSFFTVSLWDGKFPKAATAAFHLSKSFRQFNWGIEQCGPISLSFLVFGQKPMKRPIRRAQSETSICVMSVLLPPNRTRWTLQSGHISWSSYDLPFADPWLINKRFHWT